jgi:hypothetical protein
MYQYYHQKETSEQRFTMCIDVPTKEILLAFTRLEFSKDVEIPCAYTLVHDDDFYFKAIGRQICERRMKTQKFTLLCVEYIENYALLYLYNPELSITIRVHKNSDKPHFVHAELIAKEE